MLERSSAYDEIRTRLAAELGVVPGADLEELRRSSIAACRAQPGAVVVAQTRALRVDSARSGRVQRYLNRRARSTRWIISPGRSPTSSGGKTCCRGCWRRRRRVEERVPAVHIIDGMAGSGKTTLAVHLARRLSARYPDAVLFIDLCGHGEKNRVEPASALVTLLRQLEVPAERVPVEFDDQGGVVATRTGPPEVCDRPRQRREQRADPAHCCRPSRPPSCL